MLLQNTNNEDLVTNLTQNYEVSVVACHNSFHMQWTDSGLVLYFAFYIPFTFIFELNIRLNIFALCLCRLPFITH